MTTICTAAEDAADIVHEMADKKCMNCSWNSVISDDEPEERHFIKWISEDDFVERDETYLVCPSCEEAL